jgi:hypothetical protein
MRPLTWTSRNFTSINQWAPTINWTKLGDAVQAVMAGMMGKQIKSQFLCKYNTIFAHIKKIACDCSGEQNTDCYSELEYVKVGEMDLLNGLEADGEYANVRVTVGGDALENGTDISSVTVSSVQDLSPIINTGASSRKRAALASAQYDVVENANGAIVGQLVGAGAALTSETNLSSSVLLCLEIDFDIDLDNTSYPEPDIGMLEGEVVIPQGISIVIQDGTHICGNVSAEGVYFPIYRMESWENAGDDDDDDTDTDATSATVTFNWIDILFLVLFGVAFLGTIVIMFAGVRSFGINKRGKRERGEMKPLRRRR